LYVLWRNKPYAVLGKSGIWIPKTEISSKLDQVRFFEDAGEARFVQRTEYSKSGVSVLNQKAFKEKTHIKKLPVFKSTDSSKGKKKQGGRDGCNDMMSSGDLDRPCVYGEYLEKLCEGDCGQRTRVIFPPSNLEFTTGTPIQQQASTVLSDLLSHIAELEQKEQTLREEIRQLDLLNADRLHQVEMYELTDEECITFVHALHEAQLERRRRKNELSAILTEKEVLQRLDCDEMKQAVKTINSLGRQEYHCRVLPETDPIVVGHNGRQKESTRRG